MPLSKRELVKLAKIIHAGDKTSPSWLEARNRFAEHHQSLVDKTIYRIYTGDIRKHRKWEDLRQEGYIGLLEATNRVDPKLVDCFWGYAEKQVRKRVVELWYRENLPVALPQNKGSLAGKIVKIGRNHSGTLLPVEEIVSMFPDYPEKTVRDTYTALSIGATMVSIDKESWKDGMMGDSLTPRSAEHPEHEAIQGVQVDSLRRVVASLGGLETDIILVRFGFITGRPETWVGTARVLGVSVDVVKRLEQVAFAKLVHETRRAKLFL